MSFPILILVGFIFGIGFGFIVQRAGFCIAIGLGEVFIGRGKRIIRLLLLIFIISTIGFSLSHYISPGLGIKPIGQIRGYGFYNIISGMFFGAGIFINGGCILGTLRQIGEGDLTFLIVLFSFIPGMAFVVYFLDPILAEGYNIQQLTLSHLFGVPAVYISVVLAFAALFWLYSIRSHKKKIQKI